MQETDATIDNMHGLLAKAPGDDIAKVNLETIEKRRRDLERKLETSLRRG